MTGHRGAAALAKLGPGGKFIKRLFLVFFVYNSVYGPVRSSVWDSVSNSVGNNIIKQLEEETK